jgi:CubicO group peptidase (beta-lactamase class C family)
MDRTFYFAVDAISHRCAVGHVSFDEGPRVSRPWTIGRSTHPFAGMISCARDLLRWARFNLGDGTTSDGTRLLRPETLAYAQSSLGPAGSLADAIGITWQISDVGGTRVVGHGGSWCNQMSAFRMAPERSFAVVALTNAHRGAELHGEIVAAALRSYLGAAPPEPRYLDLASDQLESYVGRYDAIIDDVELSVRNGDLVLATVRRANALGTHPEPPIPPPVRLAFRDADKVVALDPPMKGNRGEFLRNPDGSIAWLRWGGRIHAWRKNT